MSVRAARSATKGAGGPPEEVTEAAEAEQVGPIFRVEGDVVGAAAVGVEVEASGADVRASVKRTAEGAAEVGEEGRGATAPSVVATTPAAAACASASKAPGIAEDAAEGHVARSPGGGGRAPRGVLGK